MRDSILNKILSRAVGNLFLITMLAGCANIGSGTISRDRFDYTDAVADSKKLFSFLMFAMTLTETGNKDCAPIMTISAG